MSDQPTDPTPEQPQTPQGPPSTFGAGEPIASEPMTTTPALPAAAKPSVGRYAIIGAVVLALGAGAVFVAKNGGGDASINAGSPTAAVENMLSVIGQGRIVDLLRGEFPWMTNLGDIEESALAAGGLPGGRIDGLTLSGEGLTYDVEEIGTELAVVTITGGSLHYGINVSKLPAAFKAAVPGGLPDTNFDQTIPIETIAAGVCASSEESCDGVQLVTVKDPGGWRVSWMHTILHLNGAGTLQPREANGAISAADIEDRIEEAIDQNDPNAFFDLLDPQEFAWVSDFELDIPSDGDPAPSVDLMFEVEDETADTAMLKLAGFESREIKTVYGDTVNPDTFEVESTEEEVLTTFDGDCIVEGSNEPKCLSDLGSLELGPFESARPLLDELTSNGIRIGVVNRDGLWYISVGATLAPFAPAFKTFGTDLTELVQRCQAEMAALDPSDPSAFSSISEECQGLAFGPLGLLSRGMSGSGGSSVAPLTQDGSYYPGG